MMRLAARRARLLRAAVAVVIASSGLAAAGVAHATPPTAPATPAQPTTKQLTREQALAKAKATGTAVTVDGASTTTDTVVANPDGTLTLTRALAPVRKRVDTSWKALDATLNRNGNGTLSPAVSTAGLTLSGGGTGPLATMTVAGTSLAISTPMTLPTPTWSGAGATYPNVLPDVDLQVTVDVQGGFSEAFVVKTPAAAANPALHTLTFPVTTNGLNLSGDGAGNLTAANRLGQAIFTAPAAVMWDSATSTPAATATDSRTRLRINAATGNPLDSTATAPGDAAHTAPVATSATATAVTLTPDPALLTAASTVYPVYIDPSWSASGGTPTAWASIAELPGMSGSKYWNKTPDPQGYMQVGNAGSMWSHTLMNLQIDLNALRGASIQSAWLNLTNVYSWSCTATTTQLYAPGTTMNSSNAYWDYWKNVNLGGVVDQPSFAHGHDSGCRADTVGFNIMSAVTADVAANKSVQTFLLQGVNEASDNNSWKEFASPNQAGYPTYSITYNHPPNTPTGLATSPNTSCTASPPTTVGDSEVTLYAPVSDPDGGSLGVHFALWKTSGSGTNLISDNLINAGSGTTATYVVPVDVFRSNSGGAITEFSWHVQVTDYIASVSAWSTTCNFNFDPTHTGQPKVSTPTSPAPAMHQPAQFTVTKPPTGTVPTSYLYQLNGAAPVAVPADIDGNATITITPTRFANVLNVTSRSAGGNVGDTATDIFSADPDNTIQADQDLTGDNIPDLLAVGGQHGIPAGLWQAQGRAGAGHTNTTGQVDPAAANIGINGNGDSTGGNSPADFTGGQPITGRFTGTGLQDVLVYYPSGPNAGLAIVINGNGDGSALQPSSDGSYRTQLGLLDTNGNNPLQIANAGDASGRGLAYPDLITISGDTNGYYLDYYPNQNAFDSYQFATQLTTATPTGGTDWNNWTITTCQISGQTDMYLWNKTTGALYLWTNLDYDISSRTLTYGSYQYTGSWNTGANLTLQAGDINGDGNPDLWAIADGRTSTDAPTTTAYLGSAPANATFTLTAGSPQTLLASDHTWLLNDAPRDAAGNPLAGGPVTSTRDVTGSMNATGSGGVTWNTGDQFSPDVNFNGTNGMLTAGGTAVNTNNDFTVSVWTKTYTETGHVITEDGNANGAFTIYPDSFNHAWSFYMTRTDQNSAPADQVNAGTVQFGVWVHLVATYDHATSRMALYVNGLLGSSTTHTANFSAPGRLQIGNYLFNGQRGGYYNGQIADVQTWNHTLTPEQIADLSGTHYQTLPGDSSTYPTGTTWTTACATTKFTAGQLTVTQTCSKTATVTFGQGGHPNASLVMQTDGNLAAYPDNPPAPYTATWQTATNGHPGATLFLQDDGNDVIYDIDGNVLWYSNTYNPIQGYALRAHANNQYVCADNAGASPLIANRTAIGPWETYDMIDLGNGNIALRAHANNRYVTAPSNGANPLIAQPDTVGTAETFQLIHNSDSSISLQAAANGMYVTADNAGTNPLIANRTTIGTWEEFDLIPL